MLNFILNWVKLFIAADIKIENILMIKNKKILRVLTFQLFLSYFLLYIVQVNR